MIRYSKHAREQMIERGISENEIEEAIKAGIKTIQEHGKILAAHRYYQVAYKKLGEDYYVITVMMR